MNRKGVALSAPGKVLLAGGYLVLDRNYTGLVFGLDARIHACVQDLPTRTGVSLSEIIVRSPQFDEAEWRYGYRLADNGGGIEVTQLTDSSVSSVRNPFVETALAYALSYVKSREVPEIGPSVVTILADNDYYSPTGADTSDPRLESRFRSFGVPIHRAHKTGLGSSAAVVTALVAAILSYYLSTNDLDLANVTGRIKLHNLAQTAHCAAQGKVGSGFDIAAAVFGSCVYRRFSASILEKLGGLGTPKFAARLKSLVDDNGKPSAWDTEITPGVRLPRGLRLAMCDVDCGSQSVSMAKGVLAWRKEKSTEANEIWSQLQRENDKLQIALERLHKMQQSHVKQYDEVLQRISTKGAPLNEVWDGIYSELCSSIAAIRASIQRMSLASDVPIEPPSQTKLLDACSGLPGVIGGLVPGAGGYDAVVLLLVDRSDIIESLQNLLRHWRVNTEDAGGVRAGQVRMLGVREELQGLRAEEVDYRPWIE
ncbi:MAG: phosphomevalonate kinase [Piccolia ochrophora]|nr:MAG: phosphomevalonate kinase [Piccolia ochrophora]